MALITIWFRQQGLTSTTCTISIWIWAISHPTWWAASTSPLALMLKSLVSLPQCKCSCSSNNNFWTLGTQTSPTWKKVSWWTTTSNTIVWCRCQIIQTKTRCSMASKPQGSSATSVILSLTLTSNWWKPPLQGMVKTSTWVPHLLQWCRTQCCTTTWAPTRCSRCSNSTVTTFHLPTRVDTITEHRLQGKYLNDAKAIIISITPLVETNKRAFQKNQESSISITFGYINERSPLWKSLQPWDSTNVNRV